MEPIKSKDVLLVSWIIGRRGVFMMLKWSKSNGGCRKNLIVVVVLLLMGNCLCPAGRASAAEKEGYFHYKLEHISYQQAKQRLTQLVEVDATPYPGTPTVLVSSDKPDELTKAKIILDLVDSPEKFVVKEILPVSAARNMPSNDQIAAKLHPSLTRGISIGNFSNPPRKDVSTRALIDIHNNAVVAIATSKLLERIESVVRPLAGLDQNQKPQVQKNSEAPDKRHVSGLIAPAEAKFVFAASGAGKTLPKDSAKAKPKPSVPKTEAKAVAAGVASNVNTADPELSTTVAGTGTADGAAVPATKTESSESVAIPDPEQVVNLALAEFDKLTIVQFLGMVGPYLQLDFLYDPKILTSEFAINPNGKWRGPIKVKDLYPMLEDVLKFNKLAMTRSGGNLVTIVPVAEAIEIDPPLVGAGLDMADRGDGIVTRVIDLKHVDTASATNLLTSMRLTIVPPIPKGKALIVTGYAHRMPRIQALLEIIDKPGEAKEFRFRPLRYTMAETLAPKLEALAENLGTISITVTQTSQATKPTTTTTGRKPGESTAAYQARVRSEATARARALAAARARTTSTTQQPTPEKPTVYLDADKRTNRILMIGLAEQLDEVEELIDTLDVAQQDLRTLELYKIVHVEAEDVLYKLGELRIITPRSRTDTYSSRITGVKPSTTTTGTARTPSTTRTPTSSRYSMYGEEELEPGEEAQVVVVEQTNSLLVNATEEQHQKIASILTYIDSEMLEDDIPVQIYPLENQSPDHLKETVLTPLIEDVLLDKEGKITGVKKKQEDQVTVVADPNTFSLIVYASKRNQEWIGTLIKNLDKRRPQVLIDVTLVEVSKSDAFNYDLNIVQSFPDLVNTSMGSVADGTSLVQALLASDRDRFVDFQSNPKAGAATGFYGDRHINALLTAMHQKDYGRVLAKPKILVNDNEEGKIKTEDVTYVTRQTSTIIEGVTNAIPSSQEFEPFDAGIELTIKPHISRGDFLRLEINLTRDDFGTITGDKPPDTTGSNIDTTVTVPDGSTIILGGMIKLNQSKGGSKVPILGDLPFVGGLFRSTSNSDLQRNLYVFVKAEIIRPPEEGLAQVDLERISERNRTAFEEHEDEFQKYHDWPGINPKTMKPEKVLDAH